MKNKYFIPHLQIFSLFFMWAISSNLLPTMIRSQKLPIGWPTFCFPYR